MKVKIPNPKFVVFYNGISSCPEIQEMKLSDLFIKNEERPTLELKCLVYNINDSFNKELLTRCKWLSDYMTFVNKVNEYHKGRDYEDLSEDIERAIDYCIANDILKEFFLDNRAEIIKMTVLDYTFERQIELEKKASFEQGEENKIVNLIKKKLNKNKSPEEIAEELEELPTLCKCKEIARYAGRKVNGEFIFDGDDILIDGSSNNVEYFPMCGKCYLQKVKKIKLDK